MRRTASVLAWVLLALTVAGTAALWSVCLFGDAPDGQGCIGAAFTVVLVPPALGAWFALHWWARR